MSGVKRAQASATRSKQPRFGLRLGVADDERRLARLRVGERQAGGKAEPRGVRVDADEPARVLDRRDDRQRRARVDLMRASRAVGHQPRQPQGEKASARQNSTPRLAR